MRVYGRVPIDPLDPQGPKRWVVVETEDGFNDKVYITAMAQTLKLNLNESPFWANFGIPARQSVLQQIMPDFYIVYTQKYYAQFFAALTISKKIVPVPNPDGPLSPVYDMSVVTHAGVRLTGRTLADNYIPQ